MLEMNPAEAAGDQGLPGMAGELLRARLREFFGGAQKEQQEAASRSGQTGAGGDAPGRVRGIAGQTGTVAGKNREDGPADR